MKPGEVARMKFVAGKMYHVFNQGNNRERIFYCKENYYLFLEKMRVHLLKHCKLLSWCLMPNHFHWMLYVPENYKWVQPENKYAPNVQPINKEIALLLSSYTNAMNKSYGRSGSLFRSRTKSKCLNDSDSRDEEYPLICFLYIHQNPLKAKLCNSLAGWPYSSYQDYSDSRSGNLCSLQLARRSLNLPEDGEEFEKFSNQSLNEDVVREIF